MINESSVSFRCVSMEDTKAAAEHFAVKYAKPGQCFALIGDLGIGKTAFSQFFIKNIIPSVEYVASPTFTIVQTYEASNGTEIWHADCYRLKSPEEFFELGLNEAFENCITIIEWPEIIREFLPKNTIEIKFTIDKNGIRIISANC